MIGMIGAIAWLASLVFVLLRVKLITLYLPFCQLSVIGHILGSLRYRRFPGLDVIGATATWIKIGARLTANATPPSSSRRRREIRVGLPSRWKRELNLFVFLIYCQLCHLYSRDYIITFRTDHPTVSRPAQKTFCLLHVKMTEATCKLPSVKSKLSTYISYSIWIIFEKGIFARFHTFHQFVDASSTRIRQIYKGFPSLVLSPGT